MDNWVLLLQALLTPVIAIATTCIAYQQYRVRRDERRLALYDRRLAIFKAVMSVMDNTRAGNALDTAEAHSWLSSIAEARFLFGAEVQLVLEELWSAVFEYAVEAEPTKFGAQYTNDCAEAANRLEDFRVAVEDVFEPYLRPAGSPRRWKRRLSVAKARRLLPTEEVSPPATPGKLKVDEDDVPF